MDYDITQYLILKDLKDRLLKDIETLKKSEVNFTNRKTALTKIEEQVKNIDGYLNQIQDNIYSSIFEMPTPEQPKEINLNDIDPTDCSYNIDTSKFLLLAEDKLNETIKLCYVNNASKYLTIYLPALMQHATQVFKHDQQVEYFFQRHENNKAYYTIQNNSMKLQVIIDYKNKIINII